MHTGSPSIISFLFERNTTTLICTSTGGPPTTITWRRNGVPVDERLFWQIQIVVDSVTATYENILDTDNTSNFIGTFTCEVSNIRGADLEILTHGTIALFLHIIIFYKILHFLLYSFCS